MKKVFLLLMCLPLFSLGQTTLYTCNFGTTPSASLTAMGKWTAANPNITYTTTSSTCSSGQGWVSIPSSGPYGSCTTTNMTIPAGNTAELSFKYLYNRSFSNPQVTVTGTSSQTYTLPQASTCSSYTIDLSSFAGQTINIKFEEKSSSTFYEFYLDDILVTYTAAVIPIESYWITAITGSGYTGILNLSPPSNSTIYLCHGSSICLETNIPLSSGSYSRRFQTSSDGGVTDAWFTWAGTTYCSPASGVRYVRGCLWSASLGVKAGSETPWLKIVHGPESVADPTNLSTTNVTPTSFTANWTSSTTVCAGGGLGILHRLEVSTDPTFATFVSGYPVDVTSCITNGASSCSYNVTGLITGLTYYWRIKAMSYHVGTNNGDLYCGVNSNYVPTSFNLPVELVGLSAVCNETTVTLSWATASETNNDYFTVEKSINTEDWLAIGNVDGSSNSNEIKHYSFEDNEPMTGISYYRLKQIDFDGKYEYFGPVAVQCNRDATGILVYPNPAQNSVFIVGSSENPADIFLCDLAGRVIAKYHCENTVTPYLVDLEKFQAGVFIILVEAQGSTDCFRIVKE